MQLVSVHFSTASFTFFDTPTICKSTSLPSVKNRTSTAFASGFSTSFDSIEDSFKAASSSFHQNLKFFYDT